MKAIFDCNYIAHKVRYGMHDITLTSETIHVEVIFGFLKQILMVTKRFPMIDDWIFCWDSKKSHRRIIYPEYKANRINKDKTDEEKQFDNVTMSQFTELRRNVLPSMGFVNNFMQTGIESDDVMASVILNNRNHYLMITSDQDMYQLLWHTLKIYSLHSKEIMDREKFIAKYDITPDLWSKAKAIGGCDTDNVKGIKGVADPAKSVKSLALAYLRGTLKRGAITERIESLEGTEIIRRNFPLVHLPFHKTKPFKLKSSSLWRKDFQDTFEKYDFQSMLRQADFRVWEVAFNLN
jgi:hypothetical protein